MNAERLLKLFHRICDAPDAIPRLRRFILDLAVRGKLVPQNPNDEPASELLKRTSANMERIAKPARITNEPTRVAKIELGDDFEIPASWCWMNLGDLAPVFQNGASSRGDSVGHPIIVIRLADIKNERFHFRTLDPCSSHKKRHLSTALERVTF